MNNSIKIILTDEEKKQAIEEAYRRQKINESENRKGRNGGAEYGKEALTIHILGAAGEMAVAKYMNMKEYLYKEKHAKRGSCDLPHNIDVKTAGKHSYRLIVQNKESKNKKYVLVTIENKEILIHGWIDGDKAMNEKFWCDPKGGRPAFFISKEHLNNMEILKNLYV